MFSYIDELRKRPLEERRSVAKTVTFLVVAVVALLWLLLSLFPVGNFFPENVENDDAAESPNQYGIVGPYE